MNNKELIQQTLGELLQKTIERKVPWTLVNPNAVRWTKGNGNQITHVTLQKQPGPIVNSTTKENYILTIQTPGTAAIQIHTQLEPTMKEALIQLFKEAMLSASDKTAEILKNLLRDL